LAHTKPPEGQSDTGTSVHGYPSIIPLQSAVDEFNARAQRDPIGKSQPPLTSAEVVAALRALGQDHRAIQPAQYKALQSIANTRVLPKGAYLRFVPGLIAVDGYDIDVWWIDLQLDLDTYPTDLADEPMHSYRLRTVCVNSRRH
jgi:hypothetical protein